MRQMSSMADTALLSRERSSGTPEGGQKNPKSQGPSQRLCTSCVQKAASPFFRPLAREAFGVREACFRFHVIPNSLSFQEREQVREFLFGHGLFKVLRHE